MSWILRLVVVTVAVILSSSFIPGIHVDTWITAITAAFVMGLINLIARPLYSLLTLPLNLITLGLLKGVFSFVLNALLFWITSKLVDGFDVNGLIPVLLGALAVTIALWIVEQLTNDE